MIRGNIDGDAGEPFPEALAINRETGDRALEEGVLYVLGQIALNRGDREEAEGLLRESLRIKKEMGTPLDDWFIVNGYTNPDTEWDFPPSRENSE